MNILLQAVANKDVAYENIMKRPTEQLQMLADALNISEKVRHDSESYDSSYNCSILANVVQCQGTHL